MNSDPLGELLGAYSKQSTPPPPDRLTAGVWHEIERRRGQTFWTRVLPLLDWHELFREPRLSASGLALAFLIGLLPAAAMRSNAQERTARDSLHFEVFTPNHLPATAFWTGPPPIRKSP